MTVFGMIILLIPYFFAGVSLLIAILQFLQIGIPFNTAYIFSSKICREAMNKKPLFMQSGIAFLFVTGIFLMMAFDMRYETGIFMLIQLLLIAGLIAFIVISNKKLK
ncbi:MAG: DUF3784 domain-containing protein [Mogibacterium sp.]|nr:DUF3784 domain-containing protein [Mogibacterium sp.]